jgi:superfamily II helicase
MKKHSEVHNVSLNSSVNDIGKTCSKCNVNKPLDCFNNDKSKKDGKTSNCKDCRKNKSLIDEVEQSYNDIHDLSQKFKDIRS